MSHHSHKTGGAHSPQPQSNSSSKHLHLPHHNNDNHFHHHLSQSHHLNAHHMNQHHMQQNTSNSTSNSSTPPSSNTSFLIKDILRYDGQKRKQRKARTAFSDHQLRELEANFEAKKYLNVQDRVELAAKLKLSDTQVKTWYQNRRTKHKRQTAVGLELLNEAGHMFAYRQVLESAGPWLLSQYASPNAAPMNVATAFLLASQAQAQAAAAQMGALQQQQQQSSPSHQQPSAQIATSAAGSGAAAAASAQHVGATSTASGLAANVTSLSQSLDLKHLLGAGAGLHHSTSTTTPPATTATTQSSSSDPKTPLFIFEQHQQQLNTQEALARFAAAAAAANMAAASGADTAKHEIS